MQHYRALDFYRFVAALGVVAFHYSHQVGGPQLLPLKHMVDFFFILSGFVIMHRYRDMHRSELAPYFAARIARIYPLHLATLGFFVLLGLARLAITGAVGPRYDFADLPQQLLLVHAWGTTDHSAFNGPSWSISAEFFVYLLFPALLLFHRRTGAWMTLGLGIAIAAALSFNDLLDPGRSWTVATHDWGAMRALPSFVIGMALAALPRPNLSWGIAYVAFGAVLFSLALGLPGEVYIVLFAGLIFVTASARGAAWIDSPRLVPLGNASYGLYMLHMPVGVAVLLAARFTGYELAWTAFGALVSVGLAMLSYRYFERPISRWAKRITSPAPAGTPIRS